MRAFPIFATLFFIVPFIEIWLLIKVGSVIGAIPTIFFVVFTSILGAYLLRQQGMATIRRFQQSVQGGQLPAKELLEGVILLMGGALLMTPGFFTDILGLICLLPFTRPLVIALLASRATVYVQGRTAHFNQGGFQSGIYPNANQGVDIEGEVVRRKNDDTLPR